MCTGHMRQDPSGLVHMRTMDAMDPPGQPARPNSASAEPRTPQLFGNTSMVLSMPLLSDQRGFAPQVRAETGGRCVDSSVHSVLF